MPIEQQTSICVLDLGSLRFFEQGPAGEKNELNGPPEPSTIFLRPRDGTAEREQMLRVLNLLSAELARSKDTQLTLADAHAFLDTKGFDRKFGDGVLRAYASSGMLEVEKDPNGIVQIRPSASGREMERRRNYSAAFASDLISQSEQLGRLIGHGPSVGAEREELLRALLERHVPKRYHVASGFVDGFRAQFDIIIYDQIDYAPLFKSGNLVVVQPQAVRAVLEVKSDLSSTSLTDALEHLSLAGFLAGGRPPVFRGVFAFSGCEARTIAKTIRHFHRPIAGEDDEGEPVVSIEQMITAVCVLEKAMVRTAFASMPKGAQFPWMPVTAIVESDAGYASQAGAFFDLLDRFLRYPYEGAFERGSLMDAVRDDLVTSNVTALFSDEDWITPLTTMGDDDRLKDRIEAYNDWLQGGQWRREIDQELA